MIGLGRMGGNMTARLEQRGHDVKTFDPQVASTASTLAELRDQLDAPRAFWLMVPSGPITEQTFQEVLELADPGDTVVDGGNSNFRDSQRRAGEASARGVDFLDVGVSGGIWGLKEGYCLMAGGAAPAVARLEPVFASLAPEGGYAHVGPPGAGHFVKMVHNGIEYGLMQAYAEGFDIMRHAADQSLPAGQRFDLDLADVAEVWRRGSVVASWLLDLTAIALAEDPRLDGYTGFVQDSGEGRWTLLAAIEEAVPADVLFAALSARFRSRQDHTFGEKLLSAMRKQFGGHVEPSRK